MFENRQAQRLAHAPAAFRNQGCVSGHRKGKGGHPKLCFWATFFQYWGRADMARRMAPVICSACRFFPASKVKVEPAKEPDCLQTAVALFHFPPAHLTAGVRLRGHEKADELCCPFSHTPVNPAFGLAWRECRTEQADSRAAFNHPTNQMLRLAWALRPIPRYFCQLQRHEQ